MSTAADWSGRAGTLQPGATYLTAQTHYRWETDAILKLHASGSFPETIEQAVGREPERQPERMVLFSDSAAFSRRLDASVAERAGSPPSRACVHHQHPETDTDIASAADIRVIATLASQALSSSDNPRHRRVRQEIRDYLRQRRVPRDREEANGG